MAREQVGVEEIKKGSVIETGGAFGLVLNNPVKPYHSYDPNWAVNVIPTGYTNLVKGSKYTVLTGEDRIKFARSLDIGRTYIGAVDTMGADPEIFAVDGRGCVIPAWEWLPKDSGRNEVFWDGFQAEFRVYEGACLEERGKSISQRLAKVQEALHAKFPNGKLTMRSVLKISEKMRAEAAEEHVQLGCQPSVNAYDMHGEPVMDGRMLAHRFAGGHIHFGVSKREVDINRAVKFLDATLGVVGVSMFEGYEDPIRRRYYGLPGEHRVKSYGFEYRTLPNTWICHPVIYMLIFELARFFVALSAVELEDAWQADSGEVMRCLMASDVKLARKILKENRGILTQFFKARWSGYQDCLFETLLKGVDKVVADPEAVVENWRMNHGGWPMYIRNAKAQIKAGEKI